MINATILILATFATTVIASTPENFSYKGSKALYVDFQTANYEIRYDIKNSKVIATSTIKFKQQKKGYPIFDLVPNAISASINGTATSISELKAPGNVTSYKTTGLEMGPGEHTLVIKNRITEAITFSNGGVQSAFWMKDLTDRKFLEQYLPTNLEYDSYKAVFDIEFVGGSAAQNLYTNGVVKKINNKRYQVTFPDYFVASSFYFHTTTPRRFYEQRFNIRSKTGRMIPVHIYSRYSSNVRKAKIETISVINELEKNFGAWPHPNILVYVAGRGGMEYCGATITSLSALGHELIHSYYARGVMPLDGNSGWIDEAIATWRGNKYPKTTVPNFSSSNMASHSPYTRNTDRDAYSKGANFMAYLNDRLDNQGGLTAFLAQMVTKYLFKQITTQIFQDELEQFSGQNFDADFKKYIYGYKYIDPAKSLPVENPFHPVLTPKEFSELL